jgi:general secretion pathway protein C
MRLQGVMLSQPASGSSAMILLSGLADRYRVGQTIKDVQLEVVAVSWDSVQLRRPDGTLVTLKFGDDSPTANSISNSASVAANPSTAPSSPSARIDSALIDAQSQLSSNPASYLTRMGLAATGQGYEVTASAPANIRNQMGLRPGDRIVSVNGQALGQPQNDARLLEQIRQTRSAQIEIQRGEQTLTIQQSF